MNLPPTESDYLKYQYDDSEKLRIRIETHERYTVGEADFNATLLKHIQPVAGLHLLDVGCGPHVQHALLQAHGLRVSGVDMSFGMLRDARTAHRQTGYAQANAVALPFGHAQFDRVLCSGVLYQVRHRIAALWELRRVTRRGGRVIVGTNGPTALQRIVDVHREATRQLGYTPLESHGATFHTDHLHEVRQVFPSVERHVIDS
jgi:ubiquinone/menaquinone biosynthesis C-methylase UbiE